jgi:ribosomal protein S12 methylthiotransferase accessory factor
VLDALPWLRRSRSPDTPGWVLELRRTLDGAGIPDLGRAVPGRELVAAAARETELIRDLRVELGRLDLELVARGDPVAEIADFVLADLTGLDSPAACELTRELHQSGRRTLSLWGRSRTTLLEMWSDPRRTACWYCCKVRFADLPAPPEQASAGPDATVVRALAENVALAVHHPDLVPYGGALVEEGENATLHGIVPLPWCSVCGGAAELGRASFLRVVSASVVPDELAGLADVRGGVVRHVVLFDSDRADAPLLPVCASAHVGPYQNGEPAYTGEGKGATTEAAVWSAIGEGLERYSASLWEPARLTRASPRELGDGAFDPRWLVLYDEAQYRASDFPFATLDPELQIQWVEGQWLDTTEPVQLPALATYMNFPAEPVERFAQVTSNGLAAGSTFQDAALRALYELIERDAFMLHWLAKRPGVPLDPAACDPVTKRALSELDRFGVRTELYLLDVGTEHPCVVCLGLGDGRSWPGATVGLAADADIDRALQRAVLEHGHFGPYLKRLMGEHDRRPISRPDQVRSALEHGLYYISTKAVSALAPLRSSPEPQVSIAALRSRYTHKRTLEACVSCLSKIGVRTAAADVTSPDVALAPIRVVRAFGTYMQPIHFGYANRRLANPRLNARLTAPPETESHPIA